LSYLDEIDKHAHVRVLRHDKPFNYSAINNFAAQHAKGDVLGLINNDVEVISPGWLSEMVTHVIRPEIGCVGAKLYYPDDTIQHAGVILGLGGVAGHSHKHLPRSAGGYFGRLKIVHNVSAVTGAALLIRKELFELVGGLDEEDLTVNFNDVDLCLKVKSAGFYNLWTPFAELYHHESKTRGVDKTPDKQARFKRECDVMQLRWSNELFKDPCYSPHLTLTREDFSIGLHT
jgi:GT2 family glycosyltransferase